MHGIALSYRFSLHQFFYMHVNINSGYVAYNALQSGRMRSAGDEWVRYNKMASGRHVRLHVQCMLAIARASIRYI